MNAEIVERAGFEGAVSELQAVLSARPEPGGDVTEWADNLREANNRLDKYLRQPEPQLRLRTPLRSPDPRVDARYFNLMMLNPGELRSIAQPGWAARVGPEQMHEDLRELNDELIWADLLMCGRGSTRYACLSGNPAVRMSTLRRWRDWELLCGDYARALSIGTSTSGGNWAPTLMSARLQDYIAPELRVALLFRQVDMTAKTFDNPVIGLDLQGYYVAEAGTIPTSDPTTLKATMTAAKIAARCIASGEVDEDTAVAMAATLRSDLGIAIGRAIEDAIINGDTDVNSASATDLDMQSNSQAVSTTANGTTTLTTAANYYTSKVAPGDVITGGSPAPSAGTTVVSITSSTSLVMSAAITAGSEPQSRTFARPSTLANHARLAWNGLREKALISNMPNQDLSTMSLANLVTLKSAMQRFDGAPPRTAWIVGYKAADSIFNSATGPVGFIPVSSLGPNANLLPGQIGELLGSPVILSDLVRHDVDSTGKNVADTTTDTKTTLLVVCRDAFLFGRRRDMVIQRAAQTALDLDQVNYSATWRGSFVEALPTAAAANKIVGIGRNI